MLVSLVRHHPLWIGFTFSDFFRIDSIVSLKALTVFHCTIWEDASSQKKSGPTNHFFWCWFFSSYRYFYFSFPIGSPPRKSNHNIHLKNNESWNFFNYFFVYLWGNEFFCGQVPKLANLIDLCADRGQIFVIGLRLPVVKLWMWCWI